MEERGARLLRQRSAAAPQERGEVPGHRRILGVGQAQGGEADAALGQRGRVDPDVRKEGVDRLPQLGRGDLGPDRPPDEAAAAAGDGDRRRSALLGAAAGVGERSELP